jgi:hypothetical protein
MKSKHFRGMHVDDFGGAIQRFLWAGHEVRTLKDIVIEKLKMTGNNHV